MTKAGIRLEYRGDLLDFSNGSSHCSTVSQYLQPLFLSYTFDLCWFVICDEVPERLILELFGWLIPSFKLEFQNALLKRTRIPADLVNFEPAHLLFWPVNGFRVFLNPNPTLSQFCCRLSQFSLFRLFLVMPLVILQSVYVTPTIRGTSSNVKVGALHSSCCNEYVLHCQNTFSSVPYKKTSESLKLNVNSNLGFLDALKVGGNKINPLLKSKRSPRYSSRIPALVIRNDYPQNADLPKYYSKKEKKPFPVPIVELRRAARERLKKSRGQPRRPMPAPKNGLLVRRLIPVAYEVLNARILLINNLKKLLKVMKVHACTCCNEIHVGPVGHPFRSCRGAGASSRRGLHDWVGAAVEDILVPVDAYHLYDRLRKRISHEERFSIPRIPAVVELCIQAGVYIPEYPAKRRRKAVIRVGKNEFIDADESDLPDPEPESPRVPILTEIHESEIVTPSSSEEIILLAEETLQAWERMSQGANKLMKMYQVRVCGYCPEVHVGPSGHKAQDCGAHKHQQRNGQHGWQRALIDDLIPPRYVWHVPDVNGPPLKTELRSFYGQAPAVVEICAQAGAAIPEQYKPTMRLDIGIPASIEEAEMVV